MEWQQIPPGAVDGVLQGYHVTYRKTDAAFPVLKNMLTVNSSFTRVIIQGVEPLTQYEVRIAGFTRKGPGPESLKVYVTTPEDGKESRTTYKGGGMGNLGLSESGTEEVFAGYLYLTISRIIQFQNAPKEFTS